MTLISSSFPSYRSFLAKKSAKEKKHSAAQRALNLAEIVEIIFKYLNRNDISRASKVSRLFYQIGTPLLYRDVCFHGATDLGLVSKFVFAMNCFDEKVINNPYSLFSTSDYLSVIKYAIENASLMLNTYMFTGSEKHPLQQCIRDCTSSRILAERMPQMAFLVPYELSKSHRFNGAVYGIVTPLTVGKIKDQPQVECKEGECWPCIQFQVKPQHHWSISKSRAYFSHGPFLQSLTISNVNITDGILTRILEKTPNLSFLSLNSCRLVTDESIKVAAVSCASRLVHLTLTNLPLLSNMALQAIAHYCPNLTALYLTDSNNITSAGVKSVLFMCPFLTMLDLSKSPNTGLGAGYGITQEVVSYRI